MQTSSSLRNLSAAQLRHLTLLSRICSCLNQTGPLGDLLGQVIEILIEGLEAQRGCIMVDQGGECPSVVAIRGSTQVPTRYSEFPFSRSVVQSVLSTGEPVVCLDLGLPSAPSTESLTSLGTRSVLCFPLRARERVIGLVYLDNHTRKVTYTQADLQVLGILADVVATTIERFRSDEAVLHQEKLASIGTLVAGLVHEMNNPLSGILISTELLKSSSDPADRPEQLELVDLVEREARRCHRLVGRLLRLARSEDREMRPISLEEVIRDSMRLLRPGLRQEGVMAEEEVVGPLPLIYGNAEELTQVVINLVANAAQAMAGRPGSRVTIRARALGDRVHLLVEDNGPGILPGSLRRIFDPFFTTKPPGQGTGLGLAIVQRIVVEHGGQVSAQNLPQGGACFSLEFCAWQPPLPLDIPPGSGL